ncbi:MAG: holo-ACP synthase [Rhodocyclaceae bacterium]|nr:holo-ACP synthase [Rhodocyclaceae bacterium]
MIFGIGTDIVSVARMEEILGRHGERFAERILTEAEREAWRRSPHGGRFLAKRFAAKEAFSKAFGTGIRPPVGFQTVFIEHDQIGKPSLGYSGELLPLMQSRKLAAHLSLSDERDYAVAFVVIEEQG